jgi:hypothetical protein
MSTAAIFEHHHRDYPVPVEVPSPEQANHEYALQEQDEQKDQQPSLWRSLLQLKVLLPYLGKILPMLEGNLSTALAPVAPRQDLTEVTRSFGDVSKGFLDVQAGQKEIRIHVQEQAVQLKRIDDQLLRLRESTERNTMEHQELVEDLRSASKLVRTLSTVMIVLMIGVAGMVAFMLTHWRH